MAEFETMKDIMGDDTTFLSKEDQDYINKVQYSEFTDKGIPNGNGQWVLRGDSIKEVLDMKQQLFGLATPAEPVKVATVVNKPEFVATTNPNIGVNGHLLAKYKLDPNETDPLLVWDLTHPCKKCKSEMAYNHNKNTVFCSKKCWLNNG